MSAGERRWGWIAGLAVLSCVAFACAATRADEGEDALPRAAARAIGREFRRADIDEVSLEREGDLTLYEVELEYGRGEIEVTVSADGVILEVETEVRDIPEAVEAAIRDAARGGKIVEMEKEEIRAVYIASLGQICELKEPVVVYEIEYVKDGDEYEARVRADGTLLGIQKGEDEEDDGDDDEDDGEEEDDD